MDYLLCHGDNYQWSCEDTADNVEKYLDFWEIIIDDIGKGFKYSNVVFIEVTEKAPEKVNNKILKLGEKMAEESFEIRLIRTHYATSL